MTSKVAARRAAWNGGLGITKSRRRQYLNNLGGFMLFDPNTSSVLSGSYLTTQQYREPEAGLEAQLALNEACALLRPLLALVLMFWSGLLVGQTSGPVPATYFGAQMQPQPGISLKKV